MGKRYLLDTNTVIYYLGGVLPENAHQFLKPIFLDQPALSVITQIELFSWNNSNAAYFDQLNKLVKKSRIIALADDVIEHCIAIRKQKKLKLPDAIIAGTALAYEYTLVTRDVTDFGTVDNLSIINPFDIQPHAD